MSTLLAASSPYGSAAFKVLLAAHILAAIVWVGGEVMLAMWHVSGDPSASEWRSDVARAVKLRQVVLLPVSAVLIACGFGLVAVGHFGFAKAWVDLALGGWVISLTTSTSYLLPAGEELAASPEPSTVRYRTLRRVELFDIAILVLVVIDMVVRPG